MRVAQTSTEAVRLEGVSIVYRLPDGTNYAAVARIDLAVAPGDFVALVGPRCTFRRSLREGMSSAQSALPGCFRQR